LNWFQQHRNEFTFQPFPNQAIKIFISLCILFWICATVLFQYYNGNEIYQFINIHYSDLGDTIFPFITRIGEFVVIGPVLILFFLLQPKEKRNTAFFVTLVLCNVVPILVNTILKNIYLEPRPMKLFENAEWFHYVAGQPLQYHRSFPSGHTCGVFTFATFLTLNLSNKYKYWSIVLFLIALLTGYSRIYLSQHFFQDVFAGSMIGTIFCTITYYTLDKLKK